VTRLLDDPAALRAADPSGLVDAYRTLPEQLATGYAAAMASVARSPMPDSITFCAMGGSAAAGDVATSVLRDRVPVPMVTVRGYDLPGHLRDGALVLCASYSGNTEETLHAFDAALDRGCRVVVVASGGRLAETATARGVTVVRLPPTAPQPRAALGLLAGAALGALEAVGVVASLEGEISEARDAVAGIAGGMGQAAPTGPNAAKAVAEWVGDRIPVIWGSEGIGEVAAWRWKCGFNENAKLPAFSSALPELDHHEIVGWAAGGGDPFRLIVLRREGEHPSVEERVAATTEQVERAGLMWRECWTPAKDALGQALGLMLVGDLASAYHALSRGLDPAPIEAIALLKARLASAQT
jgi:glucose/mannose-6-phosphate isomerase